MRVYNLTDVRTAALEVNGLLNVSFTIGDCVVAPGGSAEVLDRDLAGFAQYLILGALSRTQPVGYLDSKACRAKPVAKNALVELWEEPSEEPVAETAEEPAKPAVEQRQHWHGKKHKKY